MYKLQAAWTLFAGIREIKTPTCIVVCKFPFVALDNYHQGPKHFKGDRKCIVTLSSK